MTDQEPDLTIYITSTRDRESNTEWEATLNGEVIDSDYNKAHLIVRIEAAHNNELDIEGGRE